MQATCNAHHAKVSFELLSDCKNADVSLNHSSLPGASFLVHKRVARRALRLCFSEIEKYGRSQKQWHRFGWERNELQECCIVVNLLGVAGCMWRVRRTQWLRGLWCLDECIANQMLAG